MTDKIQILVSKGLALIEKPLDAAVSAILGAVGSIPFAGGALVTGIHAAYTFGMDYLRDSLGAKLTDLVYDKLVSPLFRTGIDKLLNISPRVRAAVERLLGRAAKYFNVLRPVTKPGTTFTFSASTGAAAQGARLNARLKGKHKLAAHDAAARAAQIRARTERDAAHRKRGLTVEHNVNGNVTSKKIWEARRKAKARRKAVKRRW